MKKISAIVLGATGMVGQRFIQLLSAHPWFEITGLTASERRAGQRYEDVCQWVLPGEMPPQPARLKLLPSEPAPGRLPNPAGAIVFSALPAAQAREVEPQFAQAGYSVCSNASAFRQAPGVPLIIPEVNASHLDLIAEQRRLYGWKGCIVTSPNCTTTGLVMPLKPLHDAFGVRQVMVTTMQAVSGAGYPGLSALDVIENVIPFIAGEEEKMEKETRLLLGDMQTSSRIEADILVSAHANRVAVIDGHTLCFSVKFTRTPQSAEAIEAMQSYRAADWISSLPSAPRQPLLVLTQPDRPQPRLDRDAENGMAAVVGRVRPCPIMDIKMTAVIHNALRGAAGGAILNAEMLAAAGYIK